MKVIFIKDVKGQGKTGEVKEVSDGYGKNFLINNGYAVLATDASMNRLKKEVSAKEALEAENIKKCEQMKKELEPKVLTFKVKAGEKDKVFGSISSKQISEELNKMGYNIDKKDIVLTDHIAFLGMHLVRVNLHKKVSLDLKVELVRE